MACSIFISNDRFIFTGNVEDHEGNITWTSPVIVLSGKHSAEDIGAAMLQVLKSPGPQIITPEEILSASGFKSWEKLTASSSMLSASLEKGKITVAPYFSGIDGEYCLVLNRDKVVDANEYEAGNAVLKSVEYCK